ncbi:MAG: thiol reductase thioredoxin [Sulfurimonas sp. RIFOXYD12_FULL_33_39]|uniref:thioredoxin family protein n=1 Tax=unclassified Sulfurimonas TaxID=2623549 RepID=UPI0008CA2890|nr:MULTISPECIES: thioredoxin family protein [unclassified Sulfurimonas]OHE05951.1 MAG: thiol reductase thioredoxin [Sulfurimonas sp. RIFCSPLOWO2_12_FULL_34_6]OHE10409.1 MAG: thiol reductase thioredoxin [Sulfurimonas sp. RIFOXYD12_FULL_33_39]OHE14866.1 MAG: thiol reductase thioredoxin [Sulfurimonas sp. RIFOXYD2_FULL_34_21]DAB27893.1 MAG TPA: thiol reductase thioredoxin [Sulfurimonas sp. UBA10385]
MQTIENIKKTIDENLAVVVYFSAPTCNVCHALKPKLLEAIENNFEKFEIVSIDTSIDQEIAASFSVFAIPTVLIFLEGKEFLRKSRHMSIDEVIREIKRPYEIMMS